jgi:hypothetical protein
MTRHEPVSDARLLFGSIFVAVSIVGIGILGGQQAPEQMTRSSQEYMTAAAGAASTTDASSTSIEQSQ